MKLFRRSFEKIIQLVQYKIKMQYYLQQLSIRSKMKKSIQPTRITSGKKVDPLPSRENNGILKQPVKTLQIFINNLDQHIAESYAKLRKNKAKNINLQITSKEQFRTVQNSVQKKKYRSFDNSQGQLCSTFKNNLGDSTCNVLESRLRDERQSPTMLCNEQVSKYINFVYQTYNIPDPLEAKKQKKLTITQSNQRKNSITTVSLRNKSSLASLKQKLVMQKNIDLTPFKTIESQKKQQNILNTSNNSVYQQLESYRFNSTYISAGYSSRKNQSSQKKNQKKLTETDFDSQVEVEQVFRYCFACEAHVLQKNLKFHQNLCKPLQQACQKSFSELLVILDFKINRLTLQVKKGILQAQPQAIMSQFQSFKQTVADWMGEISQLNNKSNQIIQKNYRMDDQYNSIKEQINQSLNSNLQSISRLRWFIRLRQNLLNKINSQM